MSSLNSKNIKYKTGRWKWKCFLTNKSWKASCFHEILTVGNQSSVMWRFVQFTILTNLRSRSDCKTESREGERGVFSSLWREERRVQSWAESFIFFLPLLLPTQTPSHRILCIYCIETCYVNEVYVWKIKPWELSVVCTVSDWLGRKIKIST